MKIIYILFACSVLFLFSCSENNPIIDNPDATTLEGSWNIEGRWNYFKVNSNELGDTIGYNLEFNEIVNINSDFYKSNLTITHLDKETIFDYEFKAPYLVYEFSEIKTNKVFIRYLDLFNYDILYDKFGFDYENYFIECNISLKENTFDTLNIDFWITSTFIEKYPILINFSGKGIRK